MLPRSSVYGGFIRMACAVCLVVGEEVLVLLMGHAVDSLDEVWLMGSLAASIWGTAAILFVAGVLRAVFGFIDYAHGLRQETTASQAPGDS